MSQSTENTEAGGAPGPTEPAAAKKPRYVWLAALVAFAALAATFALVPPSAPPPPSARRPQVDPQREEEIWRQEQQLDEGRGIIMNPAIEKLRKSKR